jgi:hypothetical protein
MSEKIENRRMTIDEIRGRLFQASKELNDVTDILNYIGERESKGLKLILHHVNWVINDAKQMIDDVDKALR